MTVSEARQFTIISVNFSQQSGDQFLGVLSSREMYLAGNQQQTVEVRNMRVPERPEGTKVVHTLKVRHIPRTYLFARVAIHLLPSSGCKRLRHWEWQKKEGCSGKPAKIWK